MPSCSPNDSKDILSIIGNRIKAHRKAQGMTREQFAEKCGLSVQSVGKIESGTRNFRIQSLVSISQVLGLSSDYLLGLSDFSDDENFQLLLSRLDTDDKNFIRRVIEAYLELEN